jgi:tetratricopeptide (TPR) repeat protein
MKAEHRKELKSNALAHAVERVLEGVKAGPSRNAVIFWGLLAVVVIAILGGRYVYQRTQESRSALWMQLDEQDQKLSGSSDLGQVDTTLKEIEEAAKENSGAPAARIMRFTRARTLLRLGVERLASAADHKQAVSQLEEARDLYAKLAEESSDVPELAQEALMGAAKAKESLGEVEDALTDYQKLARTYPSSFLGKKAQERAEYLDKPENREQVKALYATLSKMVQEKSPATTTP